MNIENYISSGIIEQCVLGLCNREEMTELETLRTQYPDLDNAIVAFEKSFEERMLKNTTAITSNKTDEQILKKLQSLNSNPMSVVKTDTNKVRNFNVAKLFAAASVALLAVSAFYNFNLYSKNKAQEDKIATIIKSQSATLPPGDFSVMQNPSITPVGMYGVGSHAICRCTMFWDKSNGKAYIMIHHLVPSGDGKEYQLWANVEGKQVNVGTVNDKIRDRFIEVTGVPENSNSFAVVLNNNGAAISPSDDNTFLISKI